MSESGEKMSEIPSSTMQSLCPSGILCIIPVACVLGGEFAGTMAEKFPDVSPNRLSMVWEPPGAGRESVGELQGTPGSLRITAPGDHRCLENALRSRVPSYSAWYFELTWGYIQLGSAKYRVKCKQECLHSVPCRHSRTLAHREHLGRNYHRVHASTTAPESL